MASREEDTLLTEPRRVITLTEKAHELYLDRVGNYKQDIKSLVTELYNFSENVPPQGSSVGSFESFSAELQNRYERYKGAVNCFIEYLESVRSEPSRLEKEKQVFDLRDTDLFITKRLQELDVHIKDLQWQSSTHVKSERASSVKSHKSASSASSLYVAKIRAKADALKAKMQFYKKEAELKKQRADIEINLEMLSAEKEVAAAEAEADALDHPCSRKSVTSMPEEKASVRVQNYVASLQPQANQTVFTEPEPTLTPIVLNPTAPSFVPYQTTMVTEMTKLLLKKDLLFSSLTMFNDCPETYNSWKHSFRSKMQELAVTALEEMDLLTKWTGPRSRVHVVNMRSAYFNDPVKGVQEIWKRLDERFGAPEVVESSLKRKLENFPKITNKDSKRLYELSDILSEIEAVKNDIRYGSVLAYFDSSTGISPVVNKLPFNLQEKWTTSAYKYMETHHVTYPPFHHFCDFLRQQSRVRNNPSFVYNATQPPKDPAPKLIIKKTAQNNEKSLGTAQTPQWERNKQEVCPLHNTNHSLLKCKKFKSKPINVRRKFLQEHSLCFRCCSSGHLYRDCKSVVACNDCGSDKHTTVMHVNFDPITRDRNHGGEHAETKPGDQQPEVHDDTIVKTACAQICGYKGNFAGKSCSKIVPAKVYHISHPDKVMKVYVLIDDQSSKSLVSPEFLNFFSDITFPCVEYSLVSCSGTTRVLGQLANGFVIESMDSSVTINLPSLRECSNIPNDKGEIPTPEVAQFHPHLRDIAKNFAPLDPNCDILLLLGRDVIEIHQVLDQKLGPRGTPFAQKLKLGWVVIGETCLDGVHPPDDLVTVYKTALTCNERPSLFKHCRSKINVHDKPTNFSCFHDVFVHTSEDERLGLSLEDSQFVSKMEKEFYRNENGDWTAPLPFKSDRPRLPNNQSQALHRARILHRNLEKNPVKRDHFVAFMKDVIENKHAEIAPPLKHNEECWYLPLFGVYHPKKKDKIRGVFDSSALYEGLSLNNVLLKGPDLTNSLVGVLLKFRKDAVALCADVEHMFYCFSVREDHRNFLRFYWYRNNDPSQDLIEYRMCKHVFGNRPSPAVATFGLRKAAQNAEDDVRKFINESFYVDDGLTSCPDNHTAISLIKRTQTVLQKEGNIRLHKIASNSKAVLSSLDPSDLAKDIKDIDIDCESLPCQRSLGVIWNLRDDSFAFLVDLDDKPFTRRGILATVNSIYDPLGFAAPVTVKGKLLLRNIIPETKDWDDPLPEHFKEEWSCWINGLQRLETVTIPRCYHSFESPKIAQQTFHVYCDASENAIAAVGFVRTVSGDETINVRLVMGKAKVAPKSGHTIPRLELCSAVLAVQVAELITHELSISPGDVVYHTDSKVVLGYLNNRIRRFYVYVTNRVHRILKFSQPSQWHYIPTNENPADHGTRYLPAELLRDSSWINGPQHLFTENSNIQEPFELVDPDKDKEIRPDVQVAKTDCTSHNSANFNLSAEKIERFSDFQQLLKTVSLLLHIVAGFRLLKSDKCYGWHLCSFHKTVESYKRAELVILKSVQKTAFHEEIECLKSGKPIPHNSSLLKLNPILNEDGILCVGGRLVKARDVPVRQRNPVIIPRKHHLGVLLVRHFHKRTHHQGRLITESAVKDNGYWIVGGKRLVSSVIYKCVVCRKLRGSLQQQQMGNLPEDRVTPGPPFTSVGVDVFGPWPVVTRRTRGGSAQNKRWAVIFTCLITRAVHIEVLEEMSSSSFINSLRRFIAIRGSVKLFRSDRGTNFIGAIADLNVHAIRVEDGPVKDFLLKNATSWIFNPPHSSHRGGTWERMIGIARKILDAMLLDNKGKQLTHEVLVTFMAEVVAVINSRPITCIPTDDDEPIVISPNFLLTQKHGFDPAPASCENMSVKEIYKAQWRHVKVLSDIFWKHWRNGYLSQLQERRKWQTPQPDIKQGDVVLLRDATEHRNMWPVGLVTKVYPSEGDNKVRTVDVKVCRDKCVAYTRPVTELVLLVE